MKTNDLRYSENVSWDAKHYCVVRVRLNDECRNGHEDFAITGDIYNRRTKKDVGGGAIGDEIAKRFPKFEIFNRLHLSDHDGYPMYAIENGFYHLTDGRNALSKEKFCECYRVTEEDYEELKTAYDQCEFFDILKTRGVFKRWKAEAKEAIRILEEWTEKEFESKAIRSQLHAPKGLKCYYEDKKAGLYTPEAKETRRIMTRIMAVTAEREKIVNTYKERAKNDERSKAIDLFLLSVIERHNFPLEYKSHVIYYSGKKTLTINWRDYDKIPAGDAGDLADIIRKELAEYDLAEHIENVEVRA